MEMNNSSRVFLSALALSFAAALTGCIGDSSSSADSNQSASDDFFDSFNPPTGDDNGDDDANDPDPVAEGTQTGFFLDAAVQGLRYETFTHSGFTGPNGEYDYEPGETVTFYLGNTRIGTHEAVEAATPLSFIDQGTHPHKSGNVLRLLQTIDATGDDSVIVIPASIRDGNYTFRFDLNEGDFIAQSGVQAMLNDFAAGEELVPWIAANQHLSNTLSNLEDNEFDLRGTYVGEWFARGCEELEANAAIFVSDSGVTSAGSEFDFDNGDCRVEEVNATGTIEQFPIFGECTGPLCSLDKLRSAINNHDRFCIDPDTSEQFFCDEEERDGVQIGYSTITISDRLNGDQLIRTKTDFGHRPGSPTDSLSNNGSQTFVMTRAEALSYRLDLTDTRWNIQEKLTSCGDEVSGGFVEFGEETSTVFYEGIEGCGPLPRESETFEYGTSDAEIFGAIDCGPVCTFAELNERSVNLDMGGEVSSVNRTFHVRGTDRITIETVLYNNGQDIPSVYTRTLVRTSD